MRRNFSVGHSRIKVSWAFQVWMGDKRFLYFNDCSYFNILLLHQNFMICPSAGVYERRATIVVHDYELLLIVNVWPIYRVSTYGNGGFKDIATSIAELIAPTPHHTILPVFSSLCEYPITIFVVHLLKSTVVQWLAPSTAPNLHL